MIDNRFKSGLNRYKSKGKSKKSVINYLTKKADILGVQVPKYITNMKNVSEKKVSQFLNTLSHKASKVIRQNEIQKIQENSYENRLNRAINNLNKTIDKVNNELYMTRPKNEVDFLTGKGTLIYGEMIQFDSAEDLILEKINPENIYVDKDSMKDMIKYYEEQNKKLKSKNIVDIVKEDNENTGVDNYIFDKIDSIKQELFESHHEDEYKKLEKRFNKMNPVQKNMIVQSYMNNMRDDYPIPEDESDQEIFELKYVNKLMRMFGEVEFS